jgi:DNA-binding transcriptional regulator YiaG
MTGKEVRTIRQRLGLTQLEFAAQVGVTRETIASWETGRHGIRESAARLMQLLAKVRVARTVKKGR